MSQSRKKRRSEKGEKKKERKRRRERENFMFTCLQERKRRREKGGEKEKTLYSHVYSSVYDPFTPCTSEGGSLVSQVLLHRVPPKVVPGLSGPVLSPCVCV
jgi:hypothetical protein